MLDGDTPEVTIGDDLTVYDPTVTFYPRWELSESVNPPAFLGAFQNEVDITTLSRQDYLPQDQFLFYGESSSGDRWVDTYSTVKNQTLLPERLVTVNDEPPSASTPSLQLSQEPPKKPGRKSKRQLSERVAPKSARHNARGDNNTDDQKRTGIVADGSGINVINGMTNRKHAKHKQVQERNRIAAEKCRMRKKEELARLQSDEQAIEQRHRMLSSCVDDLKEEILHLKTQLRCARRLSPEAAEKLSSHFVSIRRQIHDAEIEANIRSSIPITIRQLEAIVRITESLAKLTLSPVATEANVDEAIRLFLCSTMDAANQGSNQGSRELNNEVNRLETELKRRLLI
ncbi:Minichromosome maintenance protein 5 [Fusarium oxysporum f. sp. raphani]|uniref:Minichromosome maintenance protein 5 n=1 Tax=Fusarium oxysporum f. sp. raphani TaxID=96318 RepID=A0A8J5U164_FUSOX|nr:Minichromosome maintenance protein 5 [Fusarium oxysporum f. sp. raphani]KAG7426664.1 Minichromosome maintenance protein 5 [Fusarium oxysporum f. sp. raphani]